MKKFFLIPFLFYSIGFAQNKIDRDYFINLLKAKKYGQVFSEAMTLRNNKEYGKCAIIDYFIAKSFCLDNYPDKGIEWLEYILQHYALSRTNREFIEEEIRSCRPVAFNIPRPLNIYTIPLPSAGVYGTLKGGTRYDCNAKDRKIEFNNDFSEKDLESRLFRLDQKDEALAKIRSLLTDQYEVNSRDRYILVSLRSEKITRQQVLDITASLEKAYHFYVSYFGLRAPDKIITVYLLPNESSLYETAKLIHGATLPNKIYGYSLLTDLSLLGIADPERLGTLYHELFHLIVRTDLGDIPAWLDEGLASLYSTSYWKNDLLYGDKDTWRIDQLKRAYLSLTSQAIPSLVQLLSYNWQQFNGGEDLNLCQASINYAVANHLMIFLQEQNKLQAILTAYNTRKDPGDKASPPAPGDIDVLQSALGYPFDSLEARFSRWFENTYRFNLYLPGGDTPEKLNQFTEYSDISEYERSIRLMLDDLQKKHVPEEAGLAGFEKRFSLLSKSYTKLNRKFQREWDKWRRQHRILVKEEETNGPDVRQQGRKSYSYPQPAGKPKEKMDALKKAMDDEKTKMKALYIEVSETVNKYLKRATKKR